MNKEKKLSYHVLLGIAFILIAVLVATSLPKDSLATIPYTEFLSLLESKQVEEVDMLSNGDNILVTDKKGDKFRTDNPKTETFKKELLLHGIKIKNTVPPLKQFMSTSSFLMSFGFPLILVLVLYKAMGPVLKEKNSLVKEMSRVKFGDIAGNSEAK